MIKKVIAFVVLSPILIPVLAIFLPVVVVSWALKQFYNDEPSGHD